MFGGPEMFAKTTFALSGALILGAALVTLVGHAFAEDTPTSESGAWDKEWVVQGDTWIRGDEPTGSRFGTGAPTPAPRLSDPERRDRDH